MGVEICTVGGFDEVGRNCVAIKWNDEVVICDMGLNLDPYIALTEDEDLTKIDVNALYRHDAVPQDGEISEWAPLVKAIVPSHAHLDHIGAIPWIAPKYKCPVICTPFTGTVLKKIIADNEHQFPNRIQVTRSDSKVKVSQNLTVEFIHTTHSIPHAAMVAIHTPDGIILYTNDFKLDNHPTLGKKPNYNRLREIGKQGVLAMICDGLGGHKLEKCPSESIAREMLKDALLETDTQGRALVITTFSSHIARLKSIVEIGQKMNRKMVFMGRSLFRYVSAAEELGLVNFSRSVEMVRFQSQIRRKLSEMSKVGHHRFMLVVTGHQGEPNATLCKMTDGRIPFNFKMDDIVLFSCNIIPTPTNQENRDRLETALKAKGVRVLRDIHVSGHGSREDHRELIEMVKPKHIIPSHGHADLREGLAELAQERGYILGNNLHMMNNGERLKLN